VVSVAEEADGATYFVVEPNRGQLVELARLADAGELRPAIDSVFPLDEGSAAFTRVAERGKRGKVVLRGPTTEEMAEVSGHQRLARRAQRSGSPQRRLRPISTPATFG
jgi:hypothetical protein